MLKQPKINASTLATLLLSAALMLPIAERATSQSTQPGGNAISPSGPPVVEPKVEFTEEQKVKLKKAKIDSKKFKEEEEKRTKPVFYKDQKLSSNEISNLNSKHNNLYASASGKLYASVANTSRPGVFMVTYGDSSSSSNEWGGGHAAIVYNAYYTLESYGNRSSAQNGVLYWPNNWETRYQHITARTVSGTTVSQDQQAATRAAQQFKKPYNAILFNINQDNSFYYSQLVYRQFKVLFNIDMSSGFGTVFPSDLLSTTKASTLYTQ
jgi:uncharacterized protein YycO